MIQERISAVTASTANLVARELEQFLLVAFFRFDRIAKTDSVIV